MVSKAFQKILKHKTETKNVNGEIYDLEHGLRSPNEGINQRYLKNWADVAKLLFQFDHFLEAREEICKNVCWFFGIL